MQPPPRGSCKIELSLTNAAGPVDGVAVAVVPWMDAMGHGTTLKPTVSATGGGKYVISNVSFYMPGTWSLRFTFAGNVDDRATVDVEVP
jgi:hypothetical protein